MAFFRKKTAVTNDLELSVVRPDMFIGQEPTIKVGGANDISRGLFEAAIAEVPSFGDAELLFCTLHTKMQNLETYNATIQPRTKLYRLKKTLSLLDNPEGYLKYKISGSNTKKDEMVQLTSYPSKRSFFTENFDGNPKLNDENAATVNQISGQVTRNADYIISLSDLITHIQADDITDGEGWIDFAEYSDHWDDHIESGDAHLREWLITNYAMQTTGGTAQGQYYGEGFYVGGPSRFAPTLRYGELSDDEEMNISSVGWIIPLSKGIHPFEYDEYAPQEIRNAAPKWWVKASELEDSYGPLAMDVDYISEVNINREAGILGDVNEENVIFNKIRTQQPFMIPKDGGSPDEAELVSIADINFSSKNVLGGGNNVRMRTLWDWKPYDDGTMCDPTLVYDPENNMRQECFMSYGPLPRPSLGNMSGEPSKAVNVRRGLTTLDQVVDNNINITDWKDSQPLEIAFDIYFEEIAPAWIESPHQQDMEMKLATVTNDAGSTVTMTTRIATTTDAPAIFMQNNSKPGANATTKSFYFEESEMVSRKSASAVQQATNEGIQLGTDTLAASQEDGTLQAHSWDGQFKALATNTDGWVANGTYAQMQSTSSQIFDAAFAAGDTVSIRANRTLNSPIVTSRRGFFVTLGSTQPDKEHTFSDYCTKHMATVRHGEFFEQNGGNETDGPNEPHTADNQEGHPLYLLGFMYFGGSKGTSGNVRPDRKGKINVLWQGGNYGEVKGNPEASMTEHTASDQRSGSFGRHRNCWGASNRTRAAGGLGGTTSFVKTFAGGGGGGWNSTREASEVSDVRWYNLHKPNQPDSDVVTLDTQKWYKVRMFLKNGANIVSARIEEQDGTIVTTQDIDMGPSFSTNAEVNAAWAVPSDAGDPYFGDTPLVTDITNIDTYPKYITFWNNNCKWASDVVDAKGRSTVDVLTGNSDADVMARASTSVFLDKVEVSGGGWTKRLGTVSRRMPSLNTAPLPIYNKEPIVVASWDSTVNRPSIQEQMSKPMTLSFGFNNPQEVPYYVRGQHRTHNASLAANVESSTGFAGAYSFTTGQTFHAGADVGTGLAQTAALTIPIASPVGDDVQPGSINVVGLADYVTGTTHSVLTDGFFKGAIIRFINEHFGTAAVASEADPKWFAKGAWAVITDYDASGGTIFFDKVFDSTGAEITVNVSGLDHQAVAHDSTAHTAFSMASFDIINPCYLMFNGFSTGDFAITDELSGVLTGKAEKIGNTEGALSSATKPIMGWFANDVSSVTKAGGERPLTMTDIVVTTGSSTNGTSLTIDTTAGQLAIAMDAGLIAVNDYIAVKIDQSVTANRTTGRWEVMKATGLDRAGDEITVVRGPNSTSVYKNSLASLHTGFSSGSAIYRVTSLWYDAIQSDGSTGTENGASFFSLPQDTGTPFAGNSTNAVNEHLVPDAPDAQWGTSHTTNSIKIHNGATTGYADSGGPNGEATFMAEWRIPQTRDYIDATDQHLYAWLRLEFSDKDRIPTNNDDDIIQVWVTGRDTEDNIGTSDPDNYCWYKTIKTGDILDLTGKNNSDGHSIPTTKVHPDATDPEHSADSITIDNNPFVNGDIVTYLNGGAANIAGLTGGTQYYVVSQVGDDIELAATSDGSSIDLTGTGNNAQTIRGPLYSDWYLLCMSLDGGANTVGDNAPDRTNLQSVRFKVICGSFTDSTCDYDDDPTVICDANTKILVGQGVSGTGIPAGTRVSAITEGGGLGSGVTTFELTASSTGGEVINGTLTFSTIPAQDNPALQINDLWIEGSRRPEITANFSSNQGFIGQPVRQDMLLYPDRYAGSDDYYLSTQQSQAGLERGLTVGDEANEVAITTFPGAVDGFTHKGWVRVDFDPIGERKLRDTSNALTAAPLGNVLSQFTVGGGVSPHRDDMTANAGTTLGRSYFTKRENIYASTQILSLISEGSSPDGSKSGIYVTVAQPALLNNVGDNTKFVLFKQSAPENTQRVDELGSAAVRGITIEKKYMSGDEVFISFPTDKTAANNTPYPEHLDTGILDSLLELEDDGKTLKNIGRLYIGPYCYWINFMMRGDDSLPKRTYKSVVTTESPFDNNMPVGMEALGWKASGTALNLNSDGTDAQFITIGPSFNEYQYTDSISIKRWALDNETLRPSFDKGVDYGFGAADENNPSLGHCSEFYIDPETKNIPVWHEANLTSLYQKAGLKPGDDTTLMMMINDEDMDVDFEVISSETTTADDAPFLTSVFGDEIPLPPEEFKVEPMLSTSVSKDSRKKDRSDAVEIPTFTWESRDKDLWYGMLFIHNGLVTDQYFQSAAHIPFDEEPSLSGATALNKLKLHTYSPDTSTSPHTAATHALNLSATDSNYDSQAGAVATGGFTNDIEGLAGYSKMFDSNLDAVSYGTDESPYTEPSSSTEFTVITHIVPTNMVTPDLRYILYQQNKFGIYLDSSNKVNAYVYGTNGNYVHLTSATTIAADGATPTAIALVVDTELDSGNVKLYLNGELEVKSGRRVSTGTVQKWDEDDYIVVSAKPLTIGNAHIYEFTATEGSTTTITDTNELEDAFLPIDASVNDFYNGGVIQFNVSSDVNDLKCRVITDSAESGGTTTLTFTTALTDITASSKAAYLSPYAFNGKIEETIIYNKVIYITSPLSGTFAMDKPLEELTTAAYADSLTYNCKMFVKDYHNIRGVGSDVGSTRSIPLKRTAFKLNTT